MITDFEKNDTRSINTADNNSTIHGEAVMEKEKKKQKQQKWLAKATSFGDFPREKPKTSNWLLPVFAVWLVYNRFRTIIKPKDKRKTSEVRKIVGYTVLTDVKKQEGDAEAKITPPT